MGLRARRRRAARRLGRRRHPHRPPRGRPLPRPRDPGDRHRQRRRQPVGRARQPRQAVDRARPAHRGRAGDPPPPARHAPTSCSPASGPARWTASASAPTRCGPATRRSSTPAATATASAAPTPDCPGYDASAFWARGGVGHVLTPPERDYPISPARRVRRPQRRHGAGLRHRRRAAAAGARPARARSSTCRCWPPRCGRCRPTCCPPCRAMAPRAPGGPGRGEPARGVLPDEGRPPHPARVPRVRPLLGRRSARSSAEPTSPTTRASSTTTPAARTPQACVAELDERVRDADLRRVEGAARPGSTRRGRRCRPSRSCSTIRRCSPTTTSARSRSTTAARYRLPRVPVQFDERAARPAAGARARRAHRGGAARARLHWDDIAASATPR